MIEITNEDIEYAEKILLPPGKFFDTERRNFIKNLSTIDLQAVPGSGKTTALLAKLIILEKKMPFKNGSGILILSHTNTAVDELKNKIGSIAPKLFEYPNFIGTIQSFVDRFLAVPQYIQKYNKKPYRIDDEIYYEKNISLFNSLSYGTRTYLKNRKGQEKTEIDFFAKIRIDNDKNLLKNGINGDIFLKNTSNSKSYLEIYKKKELLKSDWGYLSFDDAYFLANKYILKNPIIKKLLQKRFQFIFVDEMQDMDPHQYKLLESLFYKKFVLRHGYQRIGDTNQAIHNNASSKDYWNNKREKTLELSGSHRLSQETADIVKYFGLKYVDIKGLNKNSDIKPVMIVYENPKNVLEEFSKIIKENKLDEISFKNKFPFHSIGWTSHKPEEFDHEKIRVQNYFPNFEKRLNNPQIDYKSMKDYLLSYKKTDNPLASIRKNILNIFIRILRIEKIINENKKSFRIVDFWNTLKQDEKKYNDFKSNLYNWCLRIHKNEDVYEDLKSYILEFFGENSELFRDITISQKSNDFLNADSNLNIQESEKNKTKENNVFKGSNDVKIKIGTVHSVKGETHIATLYMETSYQGNDEYESRRLPFNSKKFNDTRKYHIQSTKMTYVGFSRPTHLLCFAVKKSNYDKIDVDEEKWDIKFI